MVSWYLALFVVLAVAFPIHGLQPGFISIDCGIASNYSYTDNSTDINYISDAGFADAGVNYDVDAKYKDVGNPEPFLSLREFPDGERNCYTLQSLVQGAKYLIRASFMHGEYNGPLRSPVVFDLHIGVNIWEQVNISQADFYYWFEIITVVPMDSLSICLVKTGSNTPFISVLEARLLKSSMYTILKKPADSLILFSRLNMGDRNVDNDLIRAPLDTYDRIWKSWPTADPEDIRPTINTNKSIQMPAGDEFEVPSEVMMTGLLPFNSTPRELDFNWNVDWGEATLKVRPQFHIFMHFAELLELTKNQSRTFNITVNGQYWSGPITPDYLLATHVATVQPGSVYEYDFSLVQTPSSTLPPSINALEIYYVNSLSEKATNDGDVKGMSEIKTLYTIKKNWQGDPCVPMDFTWVGIHCSFSSSMPRIISLDLSSNNLTGNIPNSIIKLTALEVLDLSGNNLTGTIPEFLGSLTSLRLLNLSGNPLKPPIPPSLLRRQEDFSLVISVDLITTPSSPTPRPSVTPVENRLSNGKSSSPMIIPVIAAVGGIVLLLAFVFAAWKIKLRRKQKGLASVSSMKLPNEPIEPEALFQMSESQQFTYTDLVAITNNFSKVIGKGGFGVVYMGLLGDGTRVAVKLRSHSSSQGTKEFLAEAQLLTRVHHRNLVSLVGYCKESNYLALVYEYMAQGTLKEHLIGNAATLNWRERVRIGLEAAQGLDYLHKGCKPPIVHRDVKTTNILLTDKLEVKIADFGLSKAFQTDAHTHISTAVVGTLGYLDPEYHNTYQLNEKSDVYSFGIVLLELVTGLPAIMNSPEKVHIVQWVRARIARGDIADVVDGRLRGECEDNSVWKVTDIAMKCTVPDSSQRPTMGDVVTQLKESLALEVVRVRGRDLYEHDNSSDIAHYEKKSFVSGPSAR